MKYKLALAGSLALNVVFLGAICFAPERPSVPGELSAPKPLSSPQQPRIVFESEKATVTGEARPSGPSTGPSWQRSLPQLRDAGVPDDVLAGLVIADFEIRWQKQLREFEHRYQAGDVDDAERARLEARRDDEQEKVLRTALGDAGFQAWDKNHTLRDLDLVALQLSSSETDALYRLRKERALEDRMLAEALRNGEIDEADYDRQQSAAQSEYDQQFKLLLGDERYQSLQDREEGVEAALRQRTEGLGLADSQIDALVEAERNWNQQPAALDRESRQVLGAGNFELLQRSQDRRYQLLKRHANTWSLSDSDIDYIYSSVRHYQEQNSHSRQQIEQSLISYLGQERFERLKDNNLFSAGLQETPAAK